jgi:hypothetical protein
MALTGAHTPGATPLTEEDIRGLKLPHGRRTARRIGGMDGDRVSDGVFIDEDDLDEQAYEPLTLLCIVRRGFKQFKAMKIVP